MPIKSSPGGFHIQYAILKCMTTKIQKANKGMSACLLSHFSCVELFSTLWTAGRQAPLSMGMHQARILE